MLKRSSRADQPSADSSPVDDGRSKRRRVKTSRFDFQFLDNEEQLMLQQALKVSRLETKRQEVIIQEAPTYFPTDEEFGDAMGYIRKIRREAERFGICKIVPPSGWNSRCRVDMSSPKQFPTKRQRINTLQEGKGFDDGANYTAESYQTMANQFYNEWVRKHYSESNPVTKEKLAKDYWDLVETNAEEVTVDYGNDIDTVSYGSGFPGRCDDYELMDKYMRNVDFRDPEYYRHSTWNLNNIPAAPGSVLQLLEVPITGINVPWLYFGMLFSSFCWHNEDNFFYSINYNHFGAAKQWYGVPGSAAEAFEKVSKEFLMGLFRESPDLLHHMTTQVSPRLLIANGVPVYQATQEEGTFIVSFPKAFHGGFSYGFNCGEAVNFATTDWISAGAEAEERYRVFARESVFSYQRLLFTLLHNADTFRGNLKKLFKATRRIIEDEIIYREAALQRGVKDLTNVVELPPNDFRVIDDKATEFDDLRVCSICKQVCVLSAVGCECDAKQVACLRHYMGFCKCAPERKFLIEWAPRSELRSMQMKELRAGPKHE